MEILIANKLHPYSHACGCCCLLPGTAYLLEAFPNLLRFWRCTGNKPLLLAELDLALPAPLMAFSCQQDLERGQLLFFGQLSTTQEALRLTLQASSQTAGILIEVGRYPKNAPPWHFRSHAAGGHLFHCADNAEGRYDREAQVSPCRGSRFFLSLECDAIKVSIQPQPLTPRLCPRLNLGVHKAQEWEMISRRGELCEIIPFWLRLAELTPQIGPPTTEPMRLIPQWGTAALLQRCYTAQNNGDRQGAVQALQAFFQTAFTNWLIPRFSDEAHQGYCLPAAKEESFCPLNMLAVSGWLIKRFFVQMELQQAKALHVLTALPAQFVCGRLRHYDCSGLGWLDIEWSKRQPRRMIFWSHSHEQLQFIFPKEIKSLRMRCGTADSGKRLTCPLTLLLRQGQQYLFDHFTK